MLDGDATTRSHWLQRLELREVEVLLVGVLKQGNRVRGTLLIKIATGAHHKVTASGVDIDNLADFLM